MIIATILLKNCSGELRVESGEQRKQGFHIEAAPMFGKKMGDMREDCVIPHIEIQSQEAHIDLDIPGRSERVELVHPICARE